MDIVGCTGAIVDIYIYTHIVRYIVVIDWLYDGHFAAYDDSKEPIANTI